jgi:NUMOD3 motif
MARFIKGQIPWNKGLPKEQQPAFGNKNMLGKNQSDIAKKKISDSLKKQYYLGTRNSNQLRSEESIKKAALSRVGLKRSEETKRKISESHTGEKNYRWNPNREEVLENATRRKTTENNRWVKSVKNRDNWKCKVENQDCQGGLEAHHILNWIDFEELRCDINNGITLCHAHHPRGRKNEELFIETFKQLVAI